MAYWDGTKLQSSFVLTSSKTEWWERAIEIADKVALYSRGCEYGFYEQPYFIPGSIGNARQDITKLTTLAGVIFGYLHGHGITVFPIAVADWKGQLPKAVTQKRVKQRVPDHRWSSKAGHDVDAVGVGLYVLGRF